MKPLSVEIACLLGIQKEIQAVRGRMIHSPLQYYRMSKLHGTTIKTSGMKMGYGNRQSV